MTKNIFEEVSNSKLYIHIVNIIQRKVVSMDIM